MSKHTLQQVLAICVVLLITLGACSDSKDAKDAPPPPSKEDTMNMPPDIQVEPFEEMLESTYTSFQQQNYEAINAMIHPTYGLYVLHNPGAFQVVDMFKKVEDAKNTMIFSHSFPDCEFTEGNIPTYSCDTEGWSKEGCFWEAEIDADFLKMLDLMVVHELIEDYPIWESTLLEADSYISHEAYSTDGTIGFYFGLIEGEWYLIGIDAVVPCSA